MAYSLSGERPVAAASVSNIFSTIARFARKLHADRARRIALAQLLELEDHRLDDLGIVRQDVLEALANPRPSAGQLLAGKRAGRARAWSRSA